MSLSVLHETARDSSCGRARLVAQTQSEIRQMAQVKDDEPVSPVVRARQMACVHGFIHAPGCPPRCAHCGVSRSDWERMQAEHATAFPWSGMP